MMRSHVAPIRGVTVPSYAPRNSLCLNGTHVSLAFQWVVVWAPVGDRPNSTTISQVMLSRVNQSANLRSKRMCWKLQCFGGKGHILKLLRRIRKIREISLVKIVIWLPSNSSLSHSMQPRHANANVIQQVWQTGGQPELASRYRPLLNQCCSGATIDS